MDSCTNAPRDKLVPSELARLDKSLDEMKQVVDTLEERLGPVLSPPGPACEENQADVNPGCGLANEIAGVRRRTERLVAVIQELNNRLEI
jgi:hypothetical protein